MKKILLIIKAIGVGVITFILLSSIYFLTTNILSKIQSIGANTAYFFFYFFFVGPAIFIVSIFTALTYGLGGAISGLANRKSTEKTQKSRWWAKLLNGVLILIGVIFLVSIARYGFNSRTESNSQDKIVKEAIRNLDLKKCTELVNTVEVKSHSDSEIRECIKEIAVKKYGERCTGDYDVDCLMNLALTKNDVDLCPWIAGEPYSKCLNQVAVATQDADKCQNIRFSPQKSACEAYVQAVIDSNLEGCDAPYSSEYDPACVKAIAVKTQNKSLCDLINDSNCKMHVDNPPGYYLR